MVLLKHQIASVKAATPATHAGPPNCTARDSKNNCTATEPTTVYAYDNVDITYRGKTLSLGPLTNSSPLMVNQKIYVKIKDGGCQLCTRCRNRWWYVTFLWSSIIRMGNSVGRSLLFL